MSRRPGQGGRSRPDAGAASLAVLRADRAEVLTEFHVSRETAQRLDACLALLLDWQSKTNLIAPSTIPQLWRRHVADSLQLLELAPDARHWVDLGAGGGFPGLVIACALAHIPGAGVDLVESNNKKCAFLRAAARVAQVPARVACVRIEDYVDSFAGAVDVVTARALAPLETLCGYAAPLVQRGAQALFLKGQDVEAELTQASKYWNMEVDLTPSRTDRQGRIVRIRRLQRRTTGRTA